MLIRRACEEMSDAGCRLLLIEGGAMPRRLSKTAKAGRVVKSKVRSTAAKRAVVKRATGRIRTKRAGAASRALRG